MNLRRTLAVARKETLHVLRDPRALGIAIALPLFLLLLFGYALTLDVDHVPLVVWDQSNTPQSRELVSRFSGSRYFDVKAHVEGYGAIEDAILNGRTLMALVIPPDYARWLDSGRSAEVQLITDGSDANTAAIAMGYAETVVQGYSQQLRVALARRTLGRALKPPLDVRARVWFNTEMESKNFIVPGLIAVIMMLIAALLTSLTVSREWETGTMEQLISTPLRGSELVIGKLVPYFGVGMLDMVLSVMAGRFLFSVPLRGSVLLVFAMAAIYLLGSLSMGMLISIVAKNQLLANQMAFMTTFLPAFLLSGFMFDISNMPKVLQLVTYLVPARYCIFLLRSLYLKGVGPSMLWSEGVFLLAFAALMLGLSLIIFKKKLE
ncbi:MAG: ABC transporter permease [Acidobacteriota bacterium]